MLALTVLMTFSFIVSWFWIASNEEFHSPLIFVPNSVVLIIWELLSGTQENIENLGVSWNTLNLNN